MNNQQPDKSRAAAPREPHHGWWRILARLGLFFVTLLIAIATAEFLLWSFDWPRQNVPPVKDDQFSFLTGIMPPRWVNRPSSSLVFHYADNPRGYFNEKCEVSHSTNAQGFRGGDFSREKRPGALRIAFLGDSFTFGEGVRDADTFVTRIESTLRKATNRDIECLNFGVGGYNIEDGLWLLREVVLPFRPDIVVTDINISDAEPRLWVQDPITQTFHRPPTRLEALWDEIPLTPPDSFLFKSRLMQWVWLVRQNRLRDRLGIESYTSLYHDDCQSWRENRDALADITAICNAVDIPCVVAMLPSLIHLDDYPFLAAHATVKQAVGDRATFVDLLPSFAGHRDQDLWVHVTDHHPNEVAHRLIAEKLSEVLEPIVEKVAAAKSP